MKIALIRGDGIGPEVVDSAVSVLDAVAKIYDTCFEYTDVVAGGCSIDLYGIPLNEQELNKCKSADAVLLGAVGGPKWDILPGDIRPERALLALRKELNLFSNLRPAYLFPQLMEACPLRQDIAEKGIDFIIVRELTGGIYFGKRGYIDSNTAYDTETYSVLEIERIARCAFDLALKRKCKLVSVDKANVLETSRLWRKVVNEVGAKDYPQVAVEHMLVDNAAMQLIKDPSYFDVIVTSNMFGDILSDEAAMITGSIGMLNSASLGYGKMGMYEPAHGSAPDIAGKNSANPIATILSAAMMLRLSFDKPKMADLTETAVSKTLSQGFRTCDIADGKEFLGTKEITNIIIDNLT